MDSGRGFKHDDRDAVPPSRVRGGGGSPQGAYSGATVEVEASEGTGGILHDLLSRCGSVVGGGAGARGAARNALTVVCAFGTL